MEFAGGDKRWKREKADHVMGGEQEMKTERSG